MTSLFLKLRMRLAFRRAEGHLGMEKLERLISVMEGVADAIGPLKGGRKVKGFERYEVRAGADGLTMDVGTVEVVGPSGGGLFADAMACCVAIAVRDFPDVDETDMKTFFAYEFMKISKASMKVIRKEEKKARKAV
jgi:hypothetical protein